MSKTNHKNKNMDEDIDEGDQENDENLVSFSLNDHLTAMLETAADVGLSRIEMEKITNMKRKVKPRYLIKPINYKYYFVVSAVILILYGNTLPKWAFRSPMIYMIQTFQANVYDPQGRCLLQSGNYMFEMSRAVVNCKMCEGVTEVPSVPNITKQEFMKKYAYTGVPVLVKGGAGNWSALEVFSYQYFKELYLKNPAFEEFDDKCSFFGYKTNLLTLSHVFKMSKKRASLKKDQWYIGWSNCIASIQTLLRKHYTPPEFLPDDSESSSLDWIFMGGSGTGALMHIDGVNRPSWQAMIKGKKTWHIEPPPECEFRCKKHLFAIMEPGDILVIDTNKWFHSTFIHPGEMAITIGSEYD